MKHGKAQAMEQTHFCHLHQLSNNASFELSYAMAKTFPLRSKLAAFAGCRPVSICRNSDTTLTSHSLTMPSASQEATVSPFKLNIA